MDLHCDSIVLNDEQRRLDQVALLVVSYIGNLEVHMHDMDTVN